MHRLFKADGQAHAQILAPHRRVCAAAAAETAAETAAAETEAAATVSAEERGENVAEVEALKARAVTAARTAVFKGGVTVLVILCLLIRVGEHGIRLVDLLELLLRLLIARIDIGVILLGELIVCFFYG